MDNTIGGLRSQLDSNLNKWRKLPVEIEAVRYMGTVDGQVLFENPTTWLHEAVMNGQFCRDLDGYLCVKTLEGAMRVNDGAYIIQGVKGELYPCDAEIFAEIYEKVN
jgi:hypothetical protein